MTKKKPSEAETQLAILKHLRAKGIMCWRNQPMTYNHKLGMNISNPYVMRGTPDIIAVLPGGVFCGIECKTSRGVQSADQVLFQKRIEALGGVYILARSVDDVVHL